MKANRLIFNILFAILAVVTAVTKTSAQVKSNNFSINGTISGGSAPSKIYLKYDAVTEKGTDSSAVIKGKYAFKGNIELAIPATLSFDKDLISPVSPAGKISLPVMLDKGEINIVSDEKLANAVFTGRGAEAQHEYAEITGFSRRESESIKKVMEAPGYASSDSLKNIVQRRSANLLGNALSNLIKYVRQNPNSAVSPYFTYTLVASGYVTPAMIDTLIMNLPAAVKNTKIDHAIDMVMEKRKADIAQAEAKRKALEDMVPLGSKAIDFTQNDVNGKPVSLSSFKGKYVLIDFWASWCMPCRAENPNVLKAYQAHKDKGFTVLGVSLDAASMKAKWIEAIQKDGMPWTQISDLKGGNNAAAKLYGVESIPQNFLVDPNGIIVAKNLRGEQLQEKLNEIFK